MCECDVVVDPSCEYGTEYRIEGRVYEPQKQKPVTLYTPRSTYDAFTETRYGTLHFYLYRNVLQSNLRVTKPFNGDKLDLVVRLDSRRSKWY